MAAFSSLTEKLQQAFKKLRGKGILSEKDVSEAVREVRLALLEADVNYKVVKEFIGKIRERAVGQEVMKSLTPAQQVVKIVSEEMTELMGGAKSSLVVADKPPTVIMLVGLQGAGKTTTAAKLARYFRNLGRRPLLVAADVYRPAAVQQLQSLGEKLKLPVFSMGEKVEPVNIVQGAVKRAQKEGYDQVIVDTAGRLHINEQLMEELKRMKETAEAHETLLVVDAMTGQDAVKVAEAFHEKLGLTGVILTKLDGDTRGGAALSVKAVTGCPIKFIGMGEKLEALEPFYPERMTSRILGMGDVLTLIEKAQSQVDKDKAKDLERKIRENQFNLEDFLEQLQQMKSVGSLENILEMLPGNAMGKQFKNLKIGEKDLIKTEAIIQSMTIQERNNPEILNGSRKKRIASGSGTRVQDVNRLLKQFAQARQLMRQMESSSRGATGKLSKKMKNKRFHFPLFR